MTRNIWRRTAFRSASGGVEVAQDDWTLLRPSGEPLARLYKVTGGPQSGRWYSTVLFRPDGSVGSGGTGFAESERAAAARHLGRKRPGVGLGTVQQDLSQSGTESVPEWDTDPPPRNGRR
jgi:hypothetical protein